MKILERKHTPHTFDGDAPPSGEELLDRLEVPDDLSGLADAPSIGEPGDLAVTEPRRAATMVRWLRWLPLLALAVAGVVIAAIVMTSDGSATEPPWAANDGPGGHTLTVPQATLTGPTSETPWAANDGPGGHTLTVPQATSETPWAANDGPGGHTLNTVEP